MPCSRCNLEPHGSYSGKYLSEPQEINGAAVISTDCVQEPQLILAPKQHPSKSNDAAKMVAKSLLLSERPLIQLPTVITGKKLPQSEALLMSTITNGKAGRASSRVETRAQTWIGGSKRAGLHCDALGRCSVPHYAPLVDGIGPQFETS